MVYMYGIPNCETVKKARAWFTENKLAYSFHDFKKQGVPEDRLAHWLEAAGWETLLNRKGTTWRKLSPEQQSKVTDGASARALMLEYPSVIKRPVIEWSSTVTVGFNPESWPKGQ